MPHYSHNTRCFSLLLRMYLYVKKIQVCQIMVEFLYLSAILMEASTRGGG
jgi:hypothetical protein